MKKSTVIKFILLLLIILAILFFNRTYDIGQLISPTEIDIYVSSFGIWAPVIFILLYIIATIAFLPGTPITIAAGILFGTGFGLLYVIIGATIGATLAFLLARWLGEGFIKGLLKDKFKKLDAYNEKLETHGLQVVLILRLLPIFPFNGLNFALGLTGVKLKHYIIGTFLGIIPASFAFVYFGDSLKQMNLLNIIIAVVLLLVIILSYPIYKRYKQ